MYGGLRIPLSRRTHERGALAELCNCGYRRPFVLRNRPAQSEFQRCYACRERFHCRRDAGKRFLQFIRKEGARALLADGDAVLYIRRDAGRIDSARADSRAEHSGWHPSVYELHVARAHFVDRVSQLSVDGALPEGPQESRCHAGGARKLSHHLLWCSDCGDRTTRAPGRRHMAWRDPGASQHAADYALESRWKGRLPGEALTAAPGV